MSESQEENLHLDFKTVSKANFSDKSDKKNFAKSLSGFANSNGGLIIWGVIAKQNANGVDCATGSKIIDDLSLCLSKLNNLTGEYVNPIVEGVLHRKVELKKNQGYVITFVPPSDSGPHMAKAGENGYFKRSGDSFYPMEHFDIEDMFGRRKKPKLELRYFIKRFPASSAKTRFKIILSIANLGRGTAKSPFFELTVNQPYKIEKYGLDGNGNIGLPKFGASTIQHACYGASGTLVIHPGIIHEVTAVEAIINQSDLQIPDVIFQYKISAEDVRLIENDVTVSVDELLNTR